jgi:hypothetical protein
MTANKPHPNSRRHFNPGVTNTKDRIAIARLEHDIPYASTDKEGRVLSIARMVEICIDNSGVKAPLPTGLADRLADLALSPLVRLVPEQRQALQRLAGLRVAHATLRNPGLTIDATPVSDGERVIQQSPFATVVSLRPDLRRQLSDDSDLRSEGRDALLRTIGAMVVDTVRIAEGLATGTNIPSSPTT